MRLLFLLLAFSFAKVSANDVDMTLVLDFGDVSNLEFTKTYNYSMAFVNNGPEDAGTEVTSNFPVIAYSDDFTLNDNGYTDVYFTGDDSGNSCAIIVYTPSPLPGADPTISFSFHAPIIPANSSYTCTGQYLVGFEQGSRLLEFYINSFQDNELNIDDNFQNVLLGIKPQVIPVNEKFTLILMILIMLTIGQYYLRNRIKL